MESDITLSPTKHASNVSIVSLAASIDLTLQKDGQKKKDIDEK